MVGFLMSAVRTATERIPRMRPVASKLLLIALLVAACFVLAGCYDTFMG
jgi:hypothetical protein